MTILGWVFLCNMFWKPHNLHAICMLLTRLYTHEHAMLVWPLSCGGIKELYVYMLFWGCILVGLWCINLAGWPILGFGGGGMW